MTPRITLIGNVNLDLVMGPVDYWPKFGTETVLPQAEWRVGGATGNTALALQAIGSEVEIIANIGVDAFGRLLAKPFGASALRWTQAKAETALSVGLTHGDDERTFFSTLGHLAEFSLADVLSQLPDKAIAGEIALLSGVFVLPQLRKDYVKLIDVLRTRGFDVALDTGWPSQGWTDVVRSEAFAWCSQCQYLLLNEIEVRSLFGLKGEDPETMVRVVTDFLPEGGHVVMKRGMNGAAACLNGNVATAAAPRVHVVDTIGAGDVFNAGYLASISEGKSLPQALEQAVSMASFAISTSPRRYHSQPLRGAA